MPLDYNDLVVVLLSNKIWTASQQSKMAHKNILVIKIQCSGKSSSTFAAVRLVRECLLLEWCSLLWTGRSIAVGHDVGQVLIYHSC